MHVALEAAADLDGVGLDFCVYLGAFENAHESGCFEIATEFSLKGNIGAFELAVEARFSLKDRLIIYHVDKLLDSTRANGPRWAG